MTQPHLPFVAHKALAQVRQRIERAARCAGRLPEDISLIAISKTRGPGAIEPLIEAGLSTFGENRVQEAQHKWPAILARVPAPLSLHMVGQLQSNKARDAVALFDVIHSIDRPSLIEAVARAMGETARTPDCFVQVALDSDPGRGGCAVADLPSLLRQARDAGLSIVGLMAVAPLNRAPAPWFAFMAEQARRLALPRLSLGMSEDFEEAIALGATDIRVGSALFGARPEQENGPAPKDADPVG